MVTTWATSQNWGKKKIHRLLPSTCKDNNHVGSRMCTLQQHYILVSGSILSLVIHQLVSNWMSVYKSLRTLLYNSHLWVSFEVKPKLTWNHPPKSFLLSCVGAVSHDSRTMDMRTPLTKAHFRWGSQVQILRDLFGLIWSKLNPWVVGRCLQS
jgi:hypothetical protein